MKRIDSFFDKVPGDNPPKFKKQRKPNDAEKEDDAKQITSEAENSGKKTSESTSNTAKARARHFHPEWKATFPWVYYQGSILVVVRSSETTIKSCGRVSKITNSSGGRVSFKEQNFFFNFSPVNVPVF